jgi:hypothetical protein
VLCRCIESVIVRDKPACPLCRQPISADSLIDPPPAAAEGAEGALDEQVQPPQMVQAPFAVFAVLAVGSCYCAASNVCYLATLAAADGDET